MAKRYEVVVERDSGATSVAVLEVIDALPVIEAAPQAARDAEAAALAAVASSAGANAAAMAAKDSADRVDLGALDDAKLATSADRAAAEAAAEAATSQIIADIRVSTNADIPAAGAIAGQTVYVISTGHTWRWSGSAWVDLGQGPLGGKADKAEVRDGRVYTTTGGTTPSGISIPAEYSIDLLMMRHNASSSYVVWRPIGAPSDGIETDLLKRDLGGNWWSLMTDYYAASLRNAVNQTSVIPLNSAVGAQDAYVATIPEVVLAAGVTASGGAWVRFIAPATNTGPATLQVGSDIARSIVRADGGPVVAGDLRNARGYLLERRAGAWRILAGDVTDNDVDALLTLISEKVDYQDLEAALEAIQDYTWPGDTPILVTGQNGPALSITGRGSALTTLAFDPEGETDGSNHISIAEQITGEPAVWYDKETGLVFKTGDLLPSSTYLWPGDVYITIWQDLEGTPLAKINNATGEFVLSIEGDDDGGGTGDAITFADPLNVGNAWMAIESGGIVRYMSDQWAGRVFGFERHVLDHMHYHIAQSPKLAIGQIAFGGGSMMQRRSWGNPYPFHLLNAHTRYRGDGRMGADAMAVAFLQNEDAAHRGLPTVLTSNAVFGSGLTTDILDTSPAMQKVERDLVKMVEAAEAFGRVLYVDRVALALFEGEPEKGLSDALFDYGIAAKRIRSKVALATKQVGQPTFVVSQSAGTRADGTSEVILAECALDREYFALDFVVATPKYHLPLEAGSASLLTPESAAYVSEMEARAADARLNNREWFCPRITEVRSSGAVLTVKWLLTAGASLVIDDVIAHGLALTGAGASGVSILSATVTEADRMTVQLSAPLGSDDAYLCYAWGATGDRGDGLPANRGTIRDNWSATARYDPAITLHRMALSGRVQIFHEIEV